MKIYPKNQLVNIEIYDFRFTYAWEWKPAIKFLGITFRKEGYWSWNHYQKEKPEGYTFKGPDAYQNPMVSFTFTDRGCKQWFFDNLQDAEIFLRLTRIALSSCDYIPIMGELDETDSYYNCISRGDEWKHLERSR